MEKVFDSKIQSETNFIWIVPQTEVVLSWICRSYVPDAHSFPSVALFLVPAECNERKRKEIIDGQFGKDFAQNMKSSSLTSCKSICMWWTATLMEKISSYDWVTWRLAILASKAFEYIPAAKQKLPAVVLYQPSSINDVVNSLLVNVRLSTPCYYPPHCYLSQ